MKLLLFILLIGFINADTELPCQGQITIKRVKKIEKNFTGVTYLRADITLNKESFKAYCSEEFVNKIKKGIYKNALIRLGIFKEQFDSKKRYYAEYIDKNCWEIFEDTTNIKMPKIKNFKYYLGSFFRVIYPKYFIPFPIDSETNTTTNSSSDSAYFSSANKNIEFFVYFSPFNTDENNYTKLKKEELEISSSCKKTSSNSLYKNYTITTKKVFKAKDNSYTREYVLRKSCNKEILALDICEYAVFGVKYKHILNMYKKEFKKFKDSLEYYLPYP